MQAKYVGLISPAHAWILPSYYDPDWWRSPNNTDCSDEERKDILESVIFVDNVKLPPAVIIKQLVYCEIAVKYTYACVYKLAMYH